MSPNAVSIVSIISSVLWALMTASAGYLRRWTAWTAQALPADPLRLQFGREWREESYY